MPKKFSEKYLSVFLIFLGVAALLLGVIGIRSGMRAPFLRPYSGSGTSSLSLDTELKNKDTDKDGLSDYEELNLYQTSPYIEDSDSDNIPDREEIVKGSDPNCPAGQDCFASTQLSSEIFAQTGLEPIGPVAGSLRDNLRKAGLSDEVLAGINDDELLSIYEEVIGITPSLDYLPTDGFAGADESLFGDSTDYLKNISSGELRQLLVDSGIAKEFLVDIDDATLKRMFLESL